MARHSSYTPEIAEQICSRLTCGASVRSICDDDDMPSDTTVFRWLASIPAFREQYARARETRGDARFERIDDVVQDMRNGVIDSNQARVEIDAIKWQCGKEAPKRYGDKLTAELSGPDGGAIPTKVIVELVRAPKLIEE